MKFLIFLFFVFAMAEKEMLITREYVEYLKSTVSWQVTDYEDNIFKGWTDEEAMNLLGDNNMEVDVDAIPITPLTNLPTSINWRGAKCQHEILDQGNCGSCWAFASASVVSDKCCIEKQDYGWLSPQELVSCDKSQDGCSGGFAVKAFDYVKDNGLVNLECMPYIAKNSTCDETCADGRDWKESHHCKCKKIIDCSGMDKIKTCLAKGTVAARMKVYKDFFNYRSGIYCRSKDSPIMSDHAIRCVGYSMEPKEYLICANSWSTSWGDKGFFNIEPKWCSYRGAVQ